jgi:hypothetical protein
MPNTYQTKFKFSRDMLGLISKQPNYLTQNSFTLMLKMAYCILLIHELCYINRDNQQLYVLAEPIHQGNPPCIFY